ncbi:MAG: hypothetical protein ACFFBD_02595, partial [Candidatus Hodarchaeota archaeon]
RGRGDKEGQAEQYILNLTVVLMHPKEEFWKPAVDKMRTVKERYLKGEIDYETFDKKCQEIYQKAFQHQMGEDIAYEPLIRKQIALTTSIRQNREFEEQMEALGITIMQSAYMLYRNLHQTEEYQKIILNLNDRIAKESLDALDTLFRKDLTPVIDRAAKINGYAKYIVEMSVLSLWLSRTQWLMDQKHQADYRKTWDMGEYPQSLSHKDIFNYLRQWVATWLDDAFERLPPRFVQRLCGDLVKLAEMGNDFELCERATLKSLELTEGKITEATPNGICSVL